MTNIILIGYLIIITVLVKYTPGVLAANLDLITISPIPNTVNVQANYQILITPIVTPIPNNGFIGIVFPNSYKLNNELKACTISGTTISTPTCTSFSTNNSILVSNFGSSSSTNIQISINSILNPYTDTKASNFQLTTQDSTGKVLDSNYAITSWQIVPNTLTDAILTPSNQIAGGAGSFTASFTPKNSIPQNGYIIMSIPTFNGDSGATGTSVKSMITTSNPVCVANSGIESSLQCTFSSSTNLLYITQGFLKNSAYSSLVNFTVQSFLNPFSTSPKTGFVITTGYNNGNIDQSTSLSITITQPATILSGGLFLSNSTINVHTSYTFTIITSLFLESGSLIQLLFPSGLVATNVVSVQRRAPTSKVLTFEKNQTCVNITSGVDSYLDSPTSFVFQVDLITNPSTTAPTSGFSILIYDSKNKSSQVILNSPLLIVQATAGTLTVSSIIPSSRALKAITTYTFSITLANPLSSNAILLVNFATLATVANGNQNCLSSNTALGFINTGAVCVITSNGNVQVNNFLNTAYTPNKETIIITLNSVTNPTSLEPPTFTITTEDNSYAIDTISNTPLTVSLDPDPILKSGSTSILSYTANYTYDYGLYSFTFLTTNAIPVGGSIMITFPNSMKVLSTSSCSNFGGFPQTPTCVPMTSTNQISLTGGFPSSAYTPSSGPLILRISQVRNPRSMNPSTSLIIQTLTPTNYVIDQINTTLTITPTSPSTFRTGTSINPTSQTNGQSTTYTFTILPFVPPYTTDYFTIQFPSEITLSSTSTCQSISAVISSITTCIPNTSTNTLKFAFSYTMATGQLNDNESLGLRITNIKNQGIASTSNSLILSQYDQYNTLNEQKQTGLSIITTTPGTLASLKVDLTSYLMATSTYYSFNITNSLAIPANSYLTIVFSSDHNIASASLNAKSLNLGSPIPKISSNLFNLTNLPSIPSNSILSFTLNGIINPTNTNTPYSLIIKTFTQANQAIETSQSSSIVYTCTTGCSSCSLIPTNCTACLSGTPYLYNQLCYSDCPDGSINSAGYTCMSCIASSNCKKCSVNNLAQCLSCNTSFQYLSLVSSMCYQDCPNGQYNIPGTTQCASCDTTSNCGICTTTNISQCVTCLDGYYLNSLDKKCYTICPSGTVPTTDSTNTKTCLACTSSSNCYRCKLTDTSSCDTCASNSPYLSGKDNKCYATCPSNTVVKVTTDSSNTNTALYCQPCTSTIPCETCDPTNLSKCMTCPSTTPYLNINDSTCYSSCPSGTTTAGNFCILCSSSCEECAPGLPNNCTVCPSSRPKFSSADQKCYAECPAGTYTDGDSLCQACDSSCQACRGNATTCTLCPDNYFLNDIQCVQTCPNNMISRNTTCYSTNCSPGCGLCKSQSTCTECKINYALKDDGTGCIYTLKITKAKIGFPLEFLIFAIFSLLYLGYIEYKRRDNLFFNNAISILNIWEYLAWWLLTILFFVEDFPVSGAVCIIGLVANWTLNGLFYYFYHKKIVLCDEYYSKWRQNSLKQIRHIEIVSYATTLQVLRIVFGRIIPKPWVQGHFKDEHTAKKIFNNFALATLVVKEFPIILADYLSFSSINNDSQLYFCAIETFIMSCALVALTVLSYTVFGNDGFRNNNPQLPQKEAGFQRILDDTAVNESKSYSQIVHMNTSDKQISSSVARGKFTMKGIAAASPDSASEIYGLFSGEKRIKNMKKPMSKDLLNKILNDLSNLKKEESILRGKPFRYGGDNDDLSSTYKPKRRLSFTDGSSIQYEQNETTDVFQEKREDLEAYLRRVKNAKYLIKNEGFYLEEQVSKAKSVRKLKNVNNLVDFNMNLNNGLNNNEEFEFSYEFMKANPSPKGNPSSNNNTNNSNNKSPLKQGSNTNPNGVIFEEADVENGGDQELINLEEVSPQANGINQGNNTSLQGNSGTQGNNPKQGENSTTKGEMMNPETMFNDLLTNNSNPSKTERYQRTQNGDDMKKPGERNNANGGGGKNNQNNGMVNIGQDNEIDGGDGDVSDPREIQRSRLYQNDPQLKGNTAPDELGLSNLLNKFAPDSPSPTRGKQISRTTRVNKNNTDKDTAFGLNANALPPTTATGVNNSNAITIGNRNLGQNTTTAVPGYRSQSHRPRNHALETYNDDVERLMKMTVINNDYKKDLQNNQVIKKSNYGYDQISKNPNVKAELQKLHNDHLDEIIEVNNRTVRGVAYNNNLTLLTNEKIMLNDPNGINYDEPLVNKQAYTNSSGGGDGTNQQKKPVNSSRDFLSSSNPMANKVAGYDPLLKDIDTSDIVYLDQRREEDIILEVGKVVAKDPKFMKPRNDIDKSLPRGITSSSTNNGTSDAFTKQQRGNSSEKKNTYTSINMNIGGGRYESPNQYRSMYPNENLISEANALNISDVQRE